MLLHSLYLINFFSLQRHGVCSPQVVARKKHVLVMSFIGTDGQPAPKLLNAQLSTADAQIAYKQCIDVCTIPIDISDVKINFCF